MSERTPDPSVPEGEVKEEGWFGRIWAAAQEEKEALKRRVGEKTGAFGASLIDSKARDTQVEILFPDEHEAQVRRQAAASNNASQIAVGGDAVAEEIAQKTGEVGTELAIDLALERGAGAAVGAAGRVPRLIKKLPGGVNIPIGNEKYGLTHIMQRHRFSSPAENVGRFARGTSARDVKSLVGEATAGGTPWRVEGNSRVLDVNLGRVVGTDQAGNAATGIRVVTNAEGMVITSYPIGIQ